MKHSYKYLLAVLLSVLSTSIYAAGSRYDVPVADSPSWGPEDAPVTIIEFIDYQ